MECQFCSQHIQALKLTLILSTMTYHNVILKITDGKCSKAIIIIHSSQEEIIEMKLERPFQLAFKLSYWTLSIKITLWLLVKELKPVFSKALWWNHQTFSQFIHSERKVQLKSNLFTLNQISTESQSKVQLFYLTLKLLTQKAHFSKLVKHTMLTISWKSYPTLVLEKT
jgi:hypothetical protein